MFGNGLGGTVRISHCGIRSNTFHTISTLPFWTSLLTFTVNTMGIFYVFQKKVAISFNRTHLLSTTKLLKPMGNWILVA